MKDQRKLENRIMVDPLGLGKQEKKVSDKGELLGEAIERSLYAPWKGVRPDLVMHRGVTDKSGRETYILDDPVRGVHFELGEEEARFFLCLLTEKDLKSAIDRLMKTTSIRPKPEDVIVFLRMLQQEKLAVLPPEMAIAMGEKAAEKKTSLFQTLFTSYLFFKIPILRPDRLLNIIYPWLRPLWSKPFVFFYAVLGVVGLVFMFQQVELYKTTANHLFTPKGAALFFLCLAVIKVMHEFGHALAAKHYGLFVRRMGLAFMVFMPLLYTDTTDAWKLPSRKGRLYIGAAGILTEIVIAAVSIFFWAVLPDGIPRSLAFYVSSASIVSTIVVNLNPLMRFDGYYLLMDFMRISNLRSRSLEMYKYYLRRFLVDWQGPIPEMHPYNRSMAVFGLCTLMYRIAIFLSITLTIYHVVFKALGAVLVIMQIVMMIILPFIMETIFLIKNRKYWGKKRRVFITAASTCTFIFLFFVPFSSMEDLPAMVLLKDVVELTTPGPGKIVSEMPAIGTPVKKGELLVKLHDDKLEQSLKKVEFDLAQVNASIEHIGAGGEEGGYRQWLLAERKRLEAEKLKISESLKQLEVLSPMDGEILEVNEFLEKGSYTYTKCPLMRVGDKNKFEVRAWAVEDLFKDMKKKNPKTGHVFFTDLETPSMEANLAEIIDFPAVSFPNESIFDFTGGPIIANMKPRGKVEARYAHYPIRFDIQKPDRVIRHGTRCMVRIEDPERYSLVSRGVRWSMKILSAEGFI